MRNREAKQEAIRKAFGDKWDLFTEEYKNHLLIKKHWVDMSIKYGALAGVNYFKSPTPQVLTFNNEIEINCEFWRPISLKGIEDNNGWTRIEPDGSNLPIEKGKLYMPCEKGNPRPDYAVEYSTIQNGFFNGVITHYKVIEEQLNPIY